MNSPPYLTCPFVPDHAALDPRTWIPKPCVACSNHAGGADTHKGFFTHTVPVNGMMTERSPGTWRLRIFIGNDPVTGHLRQLLRTFKGGKWQASTELARFVAAVQAGDAPVSGATTLGELLDRWLEHIAPLRQPGTIRLRSRTSSASPRCWDRSDWQAGGPGPRSGLPDLAR